MTPIVPKRLQRNFVNTKIKYVGALSIALAFMVLVTGCTGSGLSVTSLSELAETSSSSLTEVTQTASLSTQSATSPSYPDQALLAQMYDDYLPSVVDLEVTKSVPAASSGGTPFGFPFGLPNAPNGSVPSMGEGTGWIYDDAGHIVTNHHVIEDAEEIIVNFANGLWAEAELVASDPQSDLAVIKIDPPSGIELEPLALATHDTLDVGHWVIAMGTPFGLEGSMTLGIVSAMGRGFPLGEADGPRYTLPDVIQTDAAINPGNSGGPLLNLEGEVVGVNFAINSPVRANSGVGFAIPVGIVERIVPALINEGAYPYPYLGISGGTITRDLIEAENLPEDARGAWVGAVVDGGPSEGILEEEDIITALDGKPVYGFDELVSHLINYTEPGQEVELTVLRGEDQITMTVTVGERPNVPQTEDIIEIDGAVSIGQAIQIGREMVAAEGLLSEIESTRAARQQIGNQRVWEVTLSGDGKTATVLVHAETGEVVGLEVE